MAWFSMLIYILWMLMGDLLGLVFLAKTCQAGNASFRSHEWCTCVACVRLCVCMTVTRQELA